MYIHVHNIYVFVDIVIREYRKYGAMHSRLECELLVGGRRTGGGRIHTQKKKGKTTGKKFT